MDWSDEALEAAKHGMNRGLANSASALLRLPEGLRARAWGAAQTATNLEGATVSAWMPQIVESLLRNPDAETWPERIAREYRERAAARKAADDGAQRAAELWRRFGKDSPQYKAQVAANRTLFEKAGIR